MRRLWPLGLEKSVWAASPRDLRKLHDCQRGTTMTEFIILVPVFIILFVGVLNLAKLNRSGLEVKMVAVRNMWDAAISKQTTFYPAPNMFTHAASGVALTNLGPIDGVADAAAAASVIAMGVQGHWGESRATVLPADPFVAISSDHPDAQLSANSVLDQPYALSLVDDSVGNNHKPLPVPPGGWYWLPWQPAHLASFAGTRAAIGGNMVYGNVSGEHQKSVSIQRMGTVQLSAHYDVMVAPMRRNGLFTEAISVGFTRLAAQENNVFKNQLSIDCSVRGGHSSPVSTAPAWALLALLGAVLRRSKKRSALSAG